MKSAANNAQESAAVDAYWVQLNYPRIKANFEAAEGRPFTHVEVAQRLAEAGFIMAPDGGYIAELAAVTAMKPGEVISMRPA